MPVNVNEVIRKLSPADCKKVEDSAAEIIAEEMSLHDLRKAASRDVGSVADSLARRAFGTIPR